MRRARTVLLLCAALILCSCSALFGPLDNPNDPNVPKSYNVTYNGNGDTGGTVPVDTNKYQVGQVATILGNTGGLSKVDFAFAGWNTKSDGTGTSYVAGDKAQIQSADITLYAQWNQTLSFGQRYSFTVGIYPEGTTVADINGDAKPDLIVVNSDSNTVSVLLNTTPKNGNTPTFSTQQQFATGSFPVPVAAADLNGDGRPDLIVGDLEVPGSISVLLNTTPTGSSSASFATKQDFSVGNPQAIATADLNGDGKPDVIVAGGGNTVSILMNTTPTGSTNASFAVTQTVTVGAGANAIAVADVNGDGKPDLIVANSQDDDVGVLLNNTPTGASSVSFRPMATYSTSPFAPALITTADLNGDGKPDILITSHTNTSSAVYAFLNTTPSGASTPSFGTAAKVPLPSSVYQFYSIVAADMNGDGSPDVLLGAFQNSPVMIISDTTAIGAASPSFATGLDFPASSSMTSVMAADINGDGKPDLVETNVESNSSNCTVSVALNTSTGP